jgi:hypothetical protein
MEAATPEQQLAASNGSGPPEALQQLVDRYNPAVFELGRRRARIRLAGAGSQDFDVLLDGHRARLVAAETERRADAVLTANADTWSAIAEDLRGGM